MGWLAFIALLAYIFFSSSKKDRVPVVARKPAYNSYTPKKTQPSPLVSKKLNEDKIFIENVKLNEEQEKLFNKIENSTDHFFITGKAGTGKSVLLQYLKFKSKKKLVVGAFTGVAALNVGGQTLNSLFQLPPGFIDISTLSLQARNSVAMLMRHVDMIVIDEISMVRVDMMGALDVLLRLARRNDIPFGGVQMVMFGDLYQLPPVVSDEGLHEYFAHNHGGPYFFNAEVWQKTRLHIFELIYNFRQKDDSQFRDLLNKVRKNEMDEDTLFELNKRHMDQIPTDGVITLAPKNDTVDYINNSKLAQIDSTQFEYRADISGNLERSAFPAEEFLRLKKGAQVMLLKNDPEKRWVNGTVGVVESLSQSEIRVKINGEIIYTIPRASWMKIKYYYDQETRKIKEEVLSTFEQFPLRLAWAFTIHKSQGKTYNSVVVNMEGGAFAHGQTYVALSRCTSLSGLYLTQPLMMEDIKLDPLVSTFMEQVIIEDVESVSNDSVEE